MLTQHELNAMRCESPGCECQEDGIVLHSRCHVDAPTWAYYQPTSGGLELHCAECDQVVATIAVAARQSNGPPAKQLH